MDNKTNFKNPGRAFRGKPLWSWNGRLEEPELKRQVDVLKEMGFGGYMMHSRTGLETEYLGEEWFDLINETADYGYENGMEAWLYDEDRWPSGTAGGLVTKDPRYQAQVIEMETYDWKTWEDSRRFSGTLAVFAVHLKDGFFTKKRVLPEGEAPGKEETVLHFSNRTLAPNHNCNGFPYLNTLDKASTQAFIESTYEAYATHSGEKFGKEITAVFTDEPQRAGMFTDFAENSANRVPYTKGIFTEFEKRFGYSMEPLLPELFLRKAGQELSEVTRDYYEICQQLFIENFSIPLFEWCQKHNLKLTGHALHENTLCCQAAMQGSLMRFYEYLDYPGIDHLERDLDCYWIAKQVDSVARQLNKPWVASELYGITGWESNFQLYKNIGDWQALFGINLRCAHLAWYTMKGQRKRDYPASFLHQSAWYPQHHYLEDYYARIHAALKDYQAVTELLVLNPIESIWSRAYSGAFDGLFAKDEELKRLEAIYADVFWNLEKNKIDFDYGEEEMMTRHAQVVDGYLQVGQCRYKKVLVAGMDTMRASTLVLLQELVAAGGEVIFAGEVPAYLDVEPSQAVGNFAKGCQQVAFNETDLVQACQPSSQITLEGDTQQQVYVRIFEKAEDYQVMVLNMDRETATGELTLRVAGQPQIQWWDARSGEIWATESQSSNDETTLKFTLVPGGEKIFHLTKQIANLPLPAKVNASGQLIDLPQDFAYALSEPNLCVLETVQATDANGQTYGPLEVLKADIAIRDQWDLPRRASGMLQPWYQEKFAGGFKDYVGNVTLNYDFNLATDLTELTLVVEDLANLKAISLNHNPIPMDSLGKWIDSCFDKLALPGNLLKQGTNTVTLIMDFDRSAGIEAAYLLGDFGVELTGSQSKIIEKPAKLAIGDISKQGFPFYSGALSYLVDAPEDQYCRVRLGAFCGALAKITGATTEEMLAFAPFEGIVKGLRSIDVVMTRRNSFGPFHSVKGASPVDFVTEGEDWVADTLVVPQGLLESVICELVTITEG